MLFALSYSVLWVLALLQLVAVLVIAQRLEYLRLASEKGLSAPARTALQNGQKAPAFSAARLGSATVARSSELFGQPSYLLFLSLTCADCRRLTERLGKAPEGSLRGLVIYCLGGQDECHNQLQPLLSRVPVLCDADIDLPSAYGVSVVPAGIVINAEGAIEEIVSAPKAEDIVAFVGRRSAIDFSATPGLMFDGPASSLVMRAGE